MTQQDVAWELYKDDEYVRGNVPAASSWEEVSKLNKVAYTVQAIVLIGLTNE